MRGASMSRRIRVAAATLAVAFAMSLGVIPAYAEDVETCTTRVVDRTDDQVLDVDAVDAAVQETVPTGADIFVRAFEVPPNGGVDAYWAQSWKDCANWRKGTAEDALPKGNIVLIVFGMDRTSAIFYGPAYNEDIGDERVNEIRADMGNFFRNGDFTGGVINAIEEVALDVDPNRPEPAQPSESAAEPDGTGWLVFGWFAGVLLGLVILIAGIISIVKLSKFIGTAKQDRADAVERARKAKKSADERVVKWSEVSAYLAPTFFGFDTLPKQVWSDDYDRVLATISRDGKHADVEYGLLGDSLHLNPDNRLTTDQYEKAAFAYETVAANLKSVLDAVEKLKQDVAADVVRFSFESQQDRIQAASRTLNSTIVRVEQYTGLFDTSSVTRQGLLLKRQVEDVAGQVQARTSQLQSYEAISEIEQKLERFTGNVASMDDAAPYLVNPERTLREAISSQVARLSGYTKVDTDEAVRSLAKLEGTIGEVLGELKPEMSHVQQAVILDSFNKRAESALASVIAADEQRREKEREARRKKEKKEQEERDEERRRSRRDSDSSAVGFGVGYAVGSSYGSSSSSSNSSHDYGGGSSGGWSSGGGDSGGGSSGGW